MERVIHLTVNGDARAVAVRPNTTLLELLREQLGLFGTKRGCDLGDCGSCTVILDGDPVKSCLVLAVAVDGGTVTTIEGLERNGKLHPLQKAFVAHGALQCGYCTPGMVLSACSLLNQNPRPSRDQIISAMDKNLCRCGGYQRAVQAIEAAAASAEGDQS